MTVNDINIDAKFRLRALRDDYIHAFVTYFVAEFTACSQRTAINTGKESEESRNVINDFIC
jgi:protein arginine N-methyltransferase 1